MDCSFGEISALGGLFTRFAKSKILNRDLISSRENYVNINSSKYYTT